MCGCLGGHAGPGRAFFVCFPSDHPVGCVERLTQLTCPAQVTAVLRGQLAQECMSSQALAPRDAAPAPEALDLTSFEPLGPQVIDPRRAYMAGKAHLLVHNHQKLPNRTQGWTDLDRCRLCTNQPRHLPHCIVLAIYP